MSTTQSQSNQPMNAAPNPNPMPNPFENIIKRTDTYLSDMKKLQDGYEIAQRKRSDIEKKEKELLKEHEEINASQNKLENDMLSMLRSVHSFLQETIAYSNEIYRRGQAEINYRIQAEAAQRALAEAAQKVLSDAAERARAEADYRKQAEAAQKQLIEQAQKAQSDAAQRIQAELTKTGHIIIDKQRITPTADVKAKPADTTILNQQKSEETALDDLKTKKK